MYHSLGQGGVPEEDRSKHQTRTEPAPPQFVPPVAPPPSGYVQHGSPYGEQHTPVTPGMQYGGAPSPGGGYQQPGVPAPGAPHDPSMGGLASQMGGLGISGDAGGSVRAHKKKGRHAYHDLGGGVASAQPQQPQQPAAPQYLDTGLNQQPPQPSSQYAASQYHNQQQQHAQPYSPSQPGIPSTGEGSVHTQGQVDPEQIPSVPRSRDLAARYYMDHVYPTMEQHLPPPATVSFLAHDQGNSSPKFARLTVNSIPASADHLSSTSLPLGLVLQPLARLDETEQQVPVLDFGDSGPPRCRRCRAYINPFMTFRSGGNRLVCNMCAFPNDVGPEYFAPLDPSGVRVDRMQRPELMQGTVEFTVPKEYWSKEPVGLRWMFLIDVSQEAVSRGFLEACCEGIMAALYGGEAEDDNENSDMPKKKLPAGSRVAIMTFDKEVHFYNISVS